MTTFTLENIDATDFNVVSDLMGKTVNILMILAFGYGYTFILDWHVARGRSIPLKALGAVPENSFQGFQHLLLYLKGSLPALLALVLLLIADFSHTLADLGLSFVNVVQQGGDEPVLSLQDQNPKIPFQAVGESGLSVRTQTFVPDGPDFQRQDRLPLALVGASDTVALGRSPLVFSALNASALLDENEEAYERGTRYQGLPAVVQYPTSENGVLASIEYEIPLTCKGTETVLQNIGTDFNQIETSTDVPECDYTQRRASGIYGQAPGRAEVVAYALMNRYPTGNLFLVNNGEKKTTVLVPASDRILARDRDDWRLGRRVSFLEAVAFGQAVIPLRDVVMVNTGPSRLTINEDGVGFREALNSYNDYVAIGSVDGTCPVAPNGQRHSSCLTITEFSCEAFPEDTAKFNQTVERTITGLLGPFPETSFCSLASVEIVWGRGFEVDETLVSMVAGVYGRNYIVARGQGLTKVGIGPNSIPAALLIQGSLTQKPSNVESIRPTINHVYIFFMMFPLVTALAIVGVAYFYSARARATGKQSNPIPMSGFELLVLGAEQQKKQQQEQGGEETDSLLQVRESSMDKFPEAPKGLVYAKRDEDLHLLIERDDGTRGKQSSASASTGVENDSGGPEASATQVELQYEGDDV